MGCSDINDLLTFIISDNFYENGIANITDPQWDKSFHDVYSAASLDIPWYPILGNHDYHVDPQAQIDRSFVEEETVWTMPSRYYVYNYTLPDGAILSVVNLDTQLIDPAHDDTGIVLENKNWRRVRTSHLQWIDDTLLEQSKHATWLVVTGHYPIYSVGVNGDNTVLLRYLAPLLVKHKVHMYIAGHDHNNQYATMNDGICYVVCGQGAGRGPFGAESVKFYGLSASSRYQKYFNGDSGFAYVSVDKNTLNTTFVDVAGNIRYTGVLQNPFSAEYRASLLTVESYSKSDNHHSQSHRGAWIAEAILIPGMLLVVVVGMYLFRDTPPVLFAIATAQQAGDKVKVLSQRVHDNIFGESGSLIRPSVDMDASTRSDVGFTADMDRSGRRENTSGPAQVGSIPVATGKYKKQPPATNAMPSTARVDLYRV